MSYRNLTPDEKGLLERILGYQPKGVAPLVRLRGDERVEEIIPDGTLKFQTKESSKQWYYPIEATFVDSDGISVNAVVFAIGDELSMLEILKADGTVPIRKPAPDEWEIVDLSTSREI